MSHPGRVTNPKHVADLKASGLTDETVVEAGLYSESNAEKVGELLGWDGPARKLDSVLVFPYHALTGEPIAYCRLKPNKPRTGKKDGAAVKYEAPRGRPPFAYFPPAVRRVWQLGEPLLVVEGEKKALAACQHGFPAIGLSGVWSWKRSDERDLLPELRGIPWQGRRVYIVFDSDRESNEKVKRAEAALAGALKQKGADVRVVALPPGPNEEKVGLDDWFVAGGTADRFRELLGRAAEPDHTPSLYPEAKGGRAAILVDVNECRVNDQAAKALATDPETFSRGGFLVRVVDEPAADLGDVQIPAGPRIVTTSRATLRERLTVVAGWFKEVGGGKEGESKFAPTRPPDWSVGAVLDRGRWPGVRRLTALVDYPVLLRAGEILATPGYHARSGLFYSPLVPVALTVPDRPTAADIRRAVAALEEVVADFPFAESHHKAAWVAGLFSPLARFTYRGCSPAFLAEANVPAAGKGLSLDAIAITVRGDGFAVATYPRDDEELRKRVTTVLVRGALMAIFDNASGEFGGPSLDALLTAPTWTDRILGESRDVTVPMLATWYATGNNLTLVGDTARRICPIRLDSPLERPEERKDLRHPDLRAWVRVERPRLLSAALTILRGYIQAGLPDQSLPVWGSYEAWSAIVRGAIVWAGWQDPAGGRVELRDRGDTETAAMGVLLSRWERLTPNGEELTAAQIVGLIDRLGEPELVINRTPDPDAEARSKDASLLIEALSTLAHGRPDTRSHKLGCKLRKYQKRIIGGRCIVQAGKSAGNLRWVVQVAGSPPPEPSPPSPPSPPPDLFDNDDRGGDGASGGDAATTPRERSEEVMEDIYPDGVPATPPLAPSPPDDGPTVDLGSFNPTGIDVLRM